MVRPACISEAADRHVDTYGIDRCFTGTGPERREAIASSTEEGLVILRVDRLQIPPPPPSDPDAWE